MPWPCLNKWKPIFSSWERPLRQLETGALNSKSIRLIFMGLALSGAAPPPLPRIESTVVSGASFDLSPDRHQVTMIHYWASWCAPCKIEMPFLDAAFRRYHPDGLAMIAIALDSGASRSKIAAASAGMAFPVARLADTKVKRHDVPAALPETRIYGRDGSLRYRFAAGGKTLDKATLDRILPALLAEN